MTLTQRERDIDASLLAVGDAPYWRKWDTYPYLLQSQINSISDEFSRIQSTRQAARSLSCAGHAKRRSKIDRTTAQLVREREARP